MRLREKETVERPVVKYAERLGLLVTKLELPHYKGLPDDLFWLPGGKPALIEFKAPGYEPEPLQWFHIKRLRKLGYMVYVVDGADEGKLLIDQLISGVEMKGHSGPLPKTVQEYEQEAQWKDGCLVWPSTSDNRVSRKIYEMRHSLKLPKDIFVCHKCDNKKCILDAHHFLGTQKENLEDASTKGRLKQTVEQIEAKRKRQTGKKGKAHTEDSKLKMSLAHMGKSPSKETVEKLSIATKGKPKRTK